MNRLSFQVGQRNRAAQGEVDSGDAIVCVVDPQRALFGVIDGSGHGETAAQASRAVLASLLDDLELPLPELVQRAHLAVRGQRGAVVGLLRVERTGGRFEAAIVGNVSVVLYRAQAGHEPYRLPLPGQPGALGGAVGRIAVQSGQTLAGDVLIVHSDGVQSRAELGPLAGLGAEECAERIVQDYGKPNDDAACLVVRVLTPSDSQRPPSMRPRLPSLVDRPELVRVLRMPLARSTDAPVVATALLGLARELGATERRAWEVSIVASELASNATKHAEGGQLDVFFDADLGELTLDVRDVGRLQAGVDRSGLGVGLQAAERLADSVEQERTAEGSRILVRKRLF